MTLQRPPLVDRRGHLAQLVVQALVIAVAFVLMSWVPLAAGALVFGISAAAWPRGALVLRLHGLWTRKRGTPWLDDARPPRISTALTAVNLAAVAAVVALGMDPPVLWAALLATAAVLVAEAVVGACLPCEAVVWAARRGLLRFRVPVGGTE